MVTKYERQESSLFRELRQEFIVKSNKNVIPFFVGKV